MIKLFFELRNMSHLHINEAQKVCCHDVPDILWLNLVSNTHYQKGEIIIIFG